MGSFYFKYFVFVNQSTNCPKLIIKLYKIYVIDREGYKNYNCPNERISLLSEYEKQKRS